MAAGYPLDAVSCTRHRHACSGGVIVAIARAACEPISRPENFSRAWPGADCESAGYAASKSLSRNSPASENGACLRDSLKILTVKEEVGFFRAKNRSDHSVSNDV